MAKPTRYTAEMFKEYIQKGYWDSVTLSDLWQQNARDYPDIEALVDSTARLTWAEANLWIDRLALGLLQLGFYRDQMLMVALPPSIELYLLRIACERAGILCLPLPMHWRKREMEHAIQIADPAGVAMRLEFRGCNYLDMFQQLRSKTPHLKHLLLSGDERMQETISIGEMIKTPIEKNYSKDHLDSTKFPAEEFSLVVNTTGTTNLPKLVENPICSRMYMAKAFMKRYKVTSQDIIGIIIPAVGGLNHVAYFGSAMLPAKVVILEHFSPEETFKLVEKEKITFMGAVPTALAQMAEHPSRTNYDLSSLRLINSAGSAMSYELGMEIEEKLGSPVTQCFAAMDAGGCTSNAADESPDVRYRTVGKPFDGNEIRLMGDDGNQVLEGEIGEIYVKGPTLVSGYYRDPKSTWEVWSRDGWYRTGDLARMDENGNFLIVGRKKDMIIRGGQNIYPIEIEELLLEHPFVAHVAVVGMSDPKMGERACAYVVTEPGAKLTFHEMINFLRRKDIAPYKLPERLEILDALPRIGEHAKIDKKALEKDIAEKLKKEQKP